MKQLGSEFVQVNLVRGDRLKGFRIQGFKELRPALADGFIRHIGPVGTVDDELEPFGTTAPVACQEGGCVSDMVLMFI